MPLEQSTKEVSKTLKNIYLCQLEELQRKSLPQASTDIQ